MTDSPHDVHDVHGVLSSDEARHTPDPDDLWNESYYCDFVHADGSLGGWLRLGLYPNRSVAWWTAWIVRPGRPGICSVDYHAPVPPGDGLVTTTTAATADSDSRIEIELRRPLHEFRLAADAPGLAAPPGPGPLSYDESGWTPTRFGVDLTWTTDGSPYHYVATTRYEIPCLVAGSVTIDGETHRVDGQGQRDHSWGVRDWWAFGWCWCSLRLHDGTRIHLSDIRIPDLPSPVFFGYVQTPSTGAVHPLTALSVKEDLGEHEFPSRVRIELAAAPAHGGIGIDVTPVALGPVLLRDDESGRTSRFPRAMLECTTDDGRRGAGWIEFNQPEPDPAPDRSSPH
jgi:hypothetical protein